MDEIFRQIQGNLHIAPEFIMTAFVVGARGVHITSCKAQAAGNTGKLL